VDERAVKERRAQADLELCQHEIERFRAREQAHLATIRQQARRIKQLERQLGTRKPRKKR
jgi:hypothetical protein